MSIEHAADPVVGPGGHLRDVLCGGRIEGVETHGPCICGAGR